MFNFVPSIDRYIFKLVVVPMLGVFALAASLLTLDKMLRLFDFVAVEGGPVGVVFKMLGALIPEYASLAIPLGLMLGILVAFRKLATSSELDVLRAVGMSYGRMLRMPYVITAVLMAVNVALVFYVQPISRYYYEQLEYELRSGALGASIKVGEFTTLADRMALRIEESEDDGTRLKGIFARVSNDKGQILSISAREGSFLATTDSPDTIILRLDDGTIVQDMGNQSPRVLAFTRQYLPIDLPAIEEFRARGDAERGAARCQPSELQFPPRRGGDDGAAASARRVARHSAQAIDQRARRVRLDRDGGLLPQDKPVRRRPRRARALRPDPRPVGAVRAVRGADRLDVLSRRPCARRTGDRRTGKLVREDRQTARQAIRTAR